MALLYGRAGRLTAKTGGFRPGQSAVSQRFDSSDGTVKLLIRLQDGLEVEAVVMVYEASTR